SRSLVILPPPPPRPTLFPYTTLFRSTCSSSSALPGGAWPSPSGCQVPGSTLGDSASEEESAAGEGWSSRPVSHSAVRPPPMPSSRSIAQPKAIAGRSRPRRRGRRVASTPGGADGDGALIALLTRRRGPPGPCSRHLLEIGCPGVACGEVAVRLEAALDPERAVLRGDGLGRLPGFPGVRRGEDVTQLLRGLRGARDLHRRGRGQALVLQ